MSSSSQSAVPSGVLLPDAHCHPQDDPDHVSRLRDVRASRIAVMGTREEDWEAVEQLYKSFPEKVWSLGACNLLIRGVNPMQHANCC